MRQPNILYLHSHDTGRFVAPYGHQVPTPNIQRLAEQGLLFRKAFCTAPTCSGSRSTVYHPARGAGAVSACDTERERLAAFHA